MPKRKTKTKPKTPEQILKAAESHRQKKYGVGLNYYDSQLEKQGGGCGICGAPPGTRRLHIDHDHSWTKVKVQSGRMHIGEWVAWTQYLNRTFTFRAITKSQAIRGVKAQLKKSSVRGLLCYSHNAGLQKFQDNPKFLRAAAKYLEDHQEIA